MKLDRLIGILSVLLQREQVTAPELAERFEVSRRTINRDVEALCAAGIPLVTRQGCGGGISIMEGYRVDRTLLTSGEMQAILAGLRSLDSVSGTDRYGRLMEKLSIGSRDILTGDQSILIDLSSWSKEAVAPRIELIQSAIHTRTVLEFTYRTQSGESVRRVEPYYLIFKWSSWYLWGYCLLREDVRMFRLDRMRELRASRARFQKRSLPAPDLSGEGMFRGSIHVKARFAPECKYRLEEEYGPDCYTVTPEGWLMVELGFGDERYLMGWILSFGDRAELLEPAELRRKLAETAARIQSRYFSLPET